MLSKYQVFITSIAARKKVPSFDDLTGILMKEEERRENVENRQHSTDLALMAKGKQTFKGKSWMKNRGRPKSKSQQGASSSKGR